MLMVTSSILVQVTSPAEWRNRLMLNDNDDDDDSSDNDNDDGTS